MHISIEMCQFGDYKLPLETITGTSQGGGGGLILNPTPVYALHLKRPR